MDSVIRYLQKDTSIDVLLEHALYAQLHMIVSDKISTSKLSSLLRQTYSDDYAAVKRFLVSPKFKPIRQTTALDLAISIQEQGAHLGIAGTNAKIHCDFLDRFNRPYYLELKGPWTRTLPFRTFEALKPLLVNGNQDLSRKQDDDLRRFLNACLCTIILDVVQNPTVIKALCPAIIPNLRLARAGYDAATYLGYAGLKGFRKCVHIDPILMQFMLQKLPLQSE
jgi:hypothetical protein